jgi:hypothetical protein
MELSQTTTARKEDDVEDVDNDDIGEEMSKQIPLEDLNPIKVRLNYE